MLENLKLQRQSYVLMHDQVNANVVGIYLVFNTEVTLGKTTIEVDILRSGRFFHY